MRMTAATRVASTAVLAGALLAASAPHGARADDGALMVSPDGATWSTNLPGGLFPSTGLLIPGSRDTSTFWVRNTTNESGYLRITLNDVVSSDSVYSDALSIAVGVPAHSGPATSMSAAGDCTVLLSGDVVPANSQIPVTVTMALGDLDGKQGQSDWNTFSVGVALSQIRPDDATCVLPDIAIPGTPAPVAASPSAPRGSAAGTPADAASTAPQSDEPTGSRLEGILVDANSGRFTDAYIIILLFIAFGLGAGWYIVGARRARRREIEEGGADQ